MLPESTDWTKLSRRKAAEVFREKEGGAFEQLSG
jgi:hypothetical protein